MRLKFLALALLSLAPLVSAQSGVGTLPDIASDPGIQAIEGNVDFICVRSRVANIPTTIHRHLAGAPGVTITASQGHLMLVASTDQPGTENATGGGTTITASWTSGGTLFTVSVTQQPNESVPDFTRRVDATVRAMQDIRPRDGAATGPLPA